MGTRATVSTTDLAAPVTSFPGVGGKTAARLDVLGIGTVRDLLRHWPRRWDDFRTVTPLDRVTRDALVVVSGTLHDVTLERRRGKRLVQVRAILRDRAGHELPVVWFNQAYLVRTLVPGREYLLAGKVAWDWYRRCLHLSSPRRDVVPGLHAVYPETEGLKSTTFRALIAPLLPQLHLPDPLPVSVGLPSLTDAVRAIHRPTSSEEAARARARLAFDEHLLLQLALEGRRNEQASRRSPRIHPAIDALQRLVASLPFEPTPGQRRAAWHIIQTLTSPSPTRHLLQGDVGSGKTLVALFVALSVLEAEQTVCWLAPTQVLARQLQVRLQVLLKATPYRVGLVAQGEDPGIVDGSHLLVGTHALLARSLPAHPALVIIDEQQRFGVDQREALTARGEEVPHVLAMTATPIPRSLALAVLGEDQLITLPDRPHHQQPVVTERVEERAAAFPVLTQALSAGQQAFVVVPRIDGDRTTLFGETIEDVARSYQQVVPPGRIGVLHGRLPADEQEHILDQFAAHELDLLVATTVVEVGVDVPNATVMVIEHAAQFGLAQLHQLRGRVGRGEQPGRCLIVAPSGDPSRVGRAEADEVAEERLAAFVRSSDGFELARLDLKLRGPGELLGTLQAGLPELKLASLDDTLAIEHARTIARRWAVDPPPELGGWLSFYGRSEEGPADGNMA